MKPRILLMIGCLLTAGSSQAATGPNDVYVALRSDGQAGHGTQVDPYDGSVVSGASRFDAVLSHLASGQSLHLGPGTFIMTPTAYNGTGNIPVGVSIVGSGMGATTLQCKVMTTAKTQYYLLGSSGVAAGASMVYRDFTLDCNGPNQPSSVMINGITQNNSGTLGMFGCERIHVINGRYSAASGGSEWFGIRLLSFGDSPYSTQSTSYQSTYIDHCLVDTFHGNGATTALASGMTTHSVVILNRADPASGGGYQVGIAGGTLVAHNVVRGATIAVYGEGGRIYDNMVDANDLQALYDCVWFNCLDTGTCSDLIIQNNRCVTLARGGISVSSSIAAPTNTGLVIQNNRLQIDDTLTTNRGHASINVQGWTKVKIAGNQLPVSLAGNYPVQTITTPNCGTVGAFENTYDTGAIVAPPAGAVTPRASFDAPPPPQSRAPVPPAEPIGLPGQRAVCYGDSITEGDGANSTGVAGGARIGEQSWPSVLQRLGFYARGTAYNLGVSGQITSQGVSEYNGANFSYGGDVNGTTYTGTAHALSPAVMGGRADFIESYGKNDQQPVAFTGNVTNGSNQVTSVTMTTGTSSQLATGSAIESVTTGLPATPTVASFSGTTATLSGNWTGTTATGVAFNLNVPLTSFATWQSQKQSLWKAARADGYRIVVLSLIPSGNTANQGSPFGQGFRSTWNAWLAQQKYNGSTVKTGWDVYVDAGSLFNPSPTAGDPYYNGDLLHPSYRGDLAIGALVDRQMWAQTGTTPSYDRYPDEPFAPGTISSHTLYVSGTMGCDFNRSDISKYAPTAPFYTLTAALAAAVAGDSIVVLDGTIADQPTLKNGVNISLQAGATWTGPATGNLMTDGGSAVTCIISGCGQTITSTAAYASLLHLSGTGSSITFSNLNLSCGAAAATVVNMGGIRDSVTVINGNVSATSATGNNSAAIFMGNAGHTFTGVGSCNISANGSPAVLFNNNATGCSVTVPGNISANSVTIQSSYNGGGSTVFCGETVSGGTGRTIGLTSAGAPAVTCGQFVEGTRSLSAANAVTILSPIAKITALANPSTSSFTQSFNGGLVDQTLHLTQTSGVMASGTFLLPADGNSRLGEICEIANDSAYAITSASITAAGGTVYGAPTTIAAGQRISVKKIASNIWSAK